METWNDLIEDYERKETRYNALTSKDELTDEEQSELESLSNEKEQEQQFWGGIDPYA